MSAEPALSGGASPGEADEARLDALDAEALLREVRELALERFPRDRRTIELFCAELARRLGGEAHADAAESPAGSFAELLTRLEELLEALLVGEAHGLDRR